MNRRKLKKIEDELLSLQASPHGVRGRVLVRIAKKLGRAKVDRGKEPTYGRLPYPHGPPARPLSIPGHAPELKTGTALSVINWLLEDVDELRQSLDQTSDESSDE